MLLNSLFLEMLAAWLQGGQRQSVVDGFKFQW